MTSPRGNMMEREGNRMTSVTGRTWGSAREQYRMTGARSRERVQGTEGGLPRQSGGPSRAEQREGVEGRRSRRPGLEASCVGAGGQERELRPRIGRQGQ